MTPGELKRANEISHRLYELEGMRSVLESGSFLSAWAKRHLPEAVVEAGVLAMQLEIEQEAAVLREELGAL